MSLTIDPLASHRSLVAECPRRPIGLVGLLAVEALALSLRFDGPPGFDPGTWWGFVIARPRHAAKLVLIATAAGAVFGGLRQAVRLLRAFEADEWSGRRWERWLLAHGLALVAFVGLSTIVCDRGVAWSGHPGAWLGAWAASALIAGVGWLGAMLPPASWLSLARRGARSLSMGAAFGIAASSGGYLTSLSWRPLAGSTFAVVRGLLALASGEVLCDPSAYTIGLANFGVRIAPECSGFEGIGLIWAFLGAYFWWDRRSLRWPRALLLLPVGTMAVWLANAARIAALILIGARWSPAVALGGFHSLAGWMAFLAVGFGLVAACRRWPFLRSEFAEEAVASAPNPAAAYLAPVMAIVAATMATGAFSAGFDAAYGLRALVGGGVLWHFRRELAGRIGSGSWVAAATGAVAFLLWMALEPAPADSARALDAGLASLPRGWAWAWLGSRVLGSVLVVPLAEELAFRGFLTRRLISADFESVPPGAFTWASFLVSSAAFGLLHGRWLAGTLVGLLFALTLYRRGKLGDAVLAHAVTNLLIAAYVLTTGNLAPWA